ncbi:hypothetical protein [Escherichia coli]|uniref:hypothetical protein n=1 Tax=Escherichia coli TaxID=562 RepID=UPI0010B64293|nr:hypothetical protein [Escherichia coli]GCG54547.1 hypothetical protein BvCms16BK_04791 [Escherichia coli]
MMKTSKAVYLGNIGNENCGFTVGKKYDVHNYEDDNYIGAFGDDGGYRHIKNGEFHKFEILEEIGVLKFKIQYEFIEAKSKNLKYFINGVKFSRDEFSEIKQHVSNLESDGVKCDTIKFEVKFE